MIVPTRRLIGIVGIGGGSLALAAALVPALSVPFALAALLLVVASLADAWTATKAARGLQASATGLTRAVRGKAFPIRVTVSKPSGEAVRQLHAALRLPPELLSPEPLLDFGTTLLPGATLALDTTLTSDVRGEYLLRECDVQTRSRFGFWSVQATCPIQSVVRVYPDLASDSAAAQFLRRGETGARIVHLAGKGREFEKLREYMPGDAWDEIDWKATARRGRPVVRVFQAEQTQEIYVAFDVSRLSGRPVGKDIALERYVNASLVLALAAESQGDRFGVITFSDRVHRFVRAGRGKTQFRICREEIYQSQPRAAEPDFGEFFAFVSSRLTRRALVIVLTVLDDPLAGEAFHRHSTIASRRHLVIAGMPAPESARPLFSRTATSTEDIYEGLSGHLRWRQLTELRKACGQKGIAMHLLDPERLSSDLAAIYLDVKRRQRL